MGRDAAPLDEQFIVLVVAERSSEVDAYGPLTGDDAADPPGFGRI